MIMILKFRNQLFRLIGVLFPERLAAWLAIKTVTPRRFRRSENEVNFLNGAISRDLKNGTKVWIYGEGPIVFAVHGWEGRGSQYQSFVEPLVTSGFQVILWDAPAHGESQGEQTNLGEFARCIVSAEKEIGDFFAVVAHSFGATSSVIASHFGLAAEKMVLIAGPRSAQALFDQIAVMLSLSPEVKRKLQNTVERIADLPAERASISVLGPELKIKPLIIHDKNDKEVPYSDAIHINNTWKGSELLLTEGLGHRRILHSKEVISKVVQFISK